MRFLFLTVPLLILRLSFYLLVFLTPVLGVWLASSLVAYINGPSWLAVFSGILLFPLLPILWDLRGQHHRQKGNLLTWGDRITLRTLSLNLLFITCLLGLRPQTSFLALSTRGDWMLDGRGEPQVELVRQGLFKLANGMEWLYLAFHNNPYQEYADVTVSPRLQPIAQPIVRPTVQPQPSQGSQQWPWEGVGLHPAIANMPAHVETSIESVAQYIAQQERDPFLRVKALHDYVADRVAYDADAYLGRIPRPSQDAETVFRTRKGVCAGYAKLLEALGQAIGEEIIYVVGDARTQTSDLSGQGHAWNAAKINGNWYLIDATWDSGFLNGGSFTKQYKTDYLFPPPDVMVISHFPDDSALQLLSQPLSRGEFLRQPMMRPQFFADGLKLITPTRSQTDVVGNAVIQLDNPRQRWLMAQYVLKGAGQGERCADQSSPASQITCSLPSSGTYEVKLFSGEQQYGQYSYVGQVEFNRR